MNDITFQKTLASVMLDNKYDRYVKHRRTGKLDTKGLHRINTSSRLFKKREERKNKDYAVTLLVDVSASMSGEKMKYARTSAVKLSHHLSLMQIPHNLIVFGSYAEEIRPFDFREDKKLGEKIIDSRAGYHIAYFFRDRDILGNGRAGNGTRLRKFCVATKGQKDWEKVIANLDGMAAARCKGDKAYDMFYTLSLAGSTSTGEGIKYARDKILKEKGRKIIIVLSDGDPEPNSGYESPTSKGNSCDSFDPETEVKITLRKGIEIYAVGILSAGANKFFPPNRACAIRDLKQLYPHVIKLIKINLKRG